MKNIMANRSDAYYAPTVCLVYLSFEFSHPSSELDQVIAAICWCTNSQSWRFTQLVGSRLGFGSCGLPPRPLCLALLLCDGYYFIKNVVGFIFCWGKEEDVMSWGKGKKQGLHRRKCLVCLSLLESSFGWQWGPVGEEWWTMRPEWEGRFSS